MARKQRGITLMSFIMVLVVVGFFALIGMKLFPMYTEYHNMKGVLEQVSELPGQGSKTLSQLQSDLERRFDIAYVSSVKKEHITLVRAGAGNQLRVAYEIRKPLIGNLDVIGKFEYSVGLQGQRTSD